MGGTWLQFYGTMGPDDGVVIAEFPDDETAAAVVLALAREGSVTPETLRAFSLEEFDDIVEALP